MQNGRNQLPVAIIGAGPVGLAAAAHLNERGLPFVIVEAGAAVGNSIREWSHVQMFSPWSYVVDKAAARLLAPTGWRSPDPESYPNGGAIVREYLEPLAAHAAIAPHLRLNQRVTAVARAGFDKLKTEGRNEAPFVLHLSASDGNESQLLARAVIDASGTYTKPNPMGANGLPALGERQLAAQIAYGIPNVRGSARERYANRRVLVIGGGHSAFNALLELIALRQTAPATQIVWAVRSDLRSLQRAYGGGSNDALPARGELGQRLRRAVDAGEIELVTSWHSERLQATPEGVVVWSGERSLPAVDELIVATGMRPDLSMFSELRLGLDPAVEAPSALAPMIDPNVHSCGTVRPHGIAELSHPEANFFIVGMKSYGRAPTFLLLTGYEQVRSVVAGLAGDWAAARRVELELPETGVCGGPVAAGLEVISNLSGGCCTPNAKKSSPTIELVGNSGGSCC